MKKRLFSYIRFSSAKQMDGNSLERQQATAERIAARYDLELDTLSFHDLGVSAFRGKNATEGNLKVFINQIGKRVPVGSWLVVENLDRLSRDDALTALDILRDILRKGITVVTGMDDKIYTNASIKNNMMDLIMSVMLFTRAHEESVTKKNRVEAQVRSSILFNQNREPGTPARSIEAVGGNTWWSCTKNGIVEPHPVYYVVAQKIIELKWSGETPGNIQRYLNDHYPTPPKRSNKGDTRIQWGINLIRKFLNPTVYGRKEFVIDKRDSAGMVIYQSCLDDEGNEYYEPEKETLVIHDYYPALMTEADYYTLLSVDKRKAVTRKTNKHPEGNPNPQIPLLSGIGVLFCGVCGTFMSKATFRNKTVKYRYVCASANVHGKPCGNTGFTAYQFEHTLLQLIADHIWNNDQEDKTEWYKAELDKADQQIKKLVRFATLTDDDIDEIAQEINTVKRNRRDLETEFTSYKMNQHSVISSGWDEFRKFDITDDTNPERMQIRIRIKQAVKRIDFSAINKMLGLFIITYMDDKTQRIVIQHNRYQKPGCVYVDATTINDKQFMEHWGLILHSFIDVLIDPEGFARKIEAMHEFSRNNRTILSDLEDDERDPGPRIPPAPIQVSSTDSGKAYATIDGVKHEIHSTEHFEELLKENGMLG
ncbi:putative phage recombinase [Buttiauxella gaviniae ATCC 51604]|uniref:Putative phage recombinase n=1 Tax=Buttiauxella gaviniae ATCC 51604 TaxID=1354253 RepID=A0A1B7HN80_9ENTR|nr:recombinase family protein [Buttiauxella gaviniae]OAT17092.1 putative phage recombinase [Buttiauxella gaviniae ATCC 51604]